MPHGSIVESPEREAQSGRDDLRHILVVDDDPMVCMAIEVYLQRNNFRVTIAEGGEAGLRALEHKQFDLMIIDIFMPHMRGFESIRISTTGLRSFR
ncbi:Response regulator receiver domain-containing protein [Bradyrhizobium yuanmingense]|uniref:Response regulator receiver domain-containing protein n=1 Tax=Bradyrhizobium yuanmingense TaxID=108015 RepID=A0A1C3UG99_9BRAD|nr:response regulator receiver domain-containing protein [Bradyrhizobium yuanmingense]SCB14469.1 Response regulator receiver domain-containing protein [Bradyrhizobium yuanmingense]